ncbi:SCO family protein [Flavihumibacter petaseus]|uniref:Putative cytochrome c oxidase accessory protein n=1 Tax=Flavihumibacter petaseus NBRC 106054 TaxID=1220578 RepID=A0A0E9MXM3_9BACT|nr:SCO family protein [Flavihumibacter petaseus]GAO42181.1 putative cytochrome c oxidase accessory protein [Flavihumibacter petaseus NBRC 106054]
MNKRALLGLSLALMLPLICYVVVKYFSGDAVHMPRRYYADTVVTRVENGKEYADTVWHKAKDFKLVNQLGDTVSMADVPGKVIVADFFFTHCPSICPILTHNMKKLQDALKLKDDTRLADTTFVQLLSFSVDPERDSSVQLKKYADKWGVNHDVWWMLTGNKKEIYDFAINEMKLAVVDGNGVDSNFIHTEKVVLLDKDRVVRGYYNGLDSLAMRDLAGDIVKLVLEKDKKKKRKLFRK